MIGATHRPWIVAHRGSSRAFRENTFAAFDAAILARVDAIELDLQLSRDDVPVAYHDRTLHRLNRTRRGIGHYSVQELRGQDFDAWFDPRGAGDTIPTLDEILLRYADHTTLMLELKADTRDRTGARDRRLAELVVKRLIHHGAQDKVYLLSFARELLDVVRAHAPAVRRVFTVPTAPAPEVDIQALLTPVAALCLPGRHASPELVEAVHAAGKELFCYRCDTASVARKALRAGADALMADDPIWLESFVAEQRRP